MGRGAGPARRARPVSRLPAGAPAEARPGPVLADLHGRQPVRIRAEGTDLVAYGFGEQRISVPARSVSHVIILGAYHELPIWSPLILLDRGQARAPGSPGHVGTRAERGAAETGPAPPGAFREHLRPLLGARAGLSEAPRTATWVPAGPGRPRGRGYWPGWARRRPRAAADTGVAVQRNLGPGSIRDGGGRRRWRGRSMAGCARRPCGAGGGPVGRRGLVG